jgi:hypothetical protein
MLAAYWNKNSMSTNNYLFEKMFFQAARIAILEEALETLYEDLKKIQLAGKLDLSTEIAKIEIAYQSIEKLDKGSKK